ncbi:MAG: LuxR family transcriptional regulator [Rickettsiales bacterium]|nr:LuxR family transcriptional regulator [Pseudomonadota bacterium]MDA0965609.1 LuxR family transcriptional regulator [Pseudomonadota bacterium]MDG4542933.1 LuxR family transcriptional regulator [Rickettsiales bacterium]MDG4544619.1 LuxR family transcriptional regulator [Rickettsiales bacterium]MDG4546741.1 LuxR family transcriptional regulator [Rickettsiales bacterium]
MLVDNFIDESYQLKDSEKLIGLFERAISSLGFDKFVYSFMTEQPSIKETAKHGVIRSYPDDWMKHYLEKDYINIDPTYRLALRTPGVFSWKELEERISLPEISVKMMREAQDANIKSGASVSIHGMNNDVVGMGFASSENDANTSKCSLHRLHALAHQFHLVYTDIFSLENNNVFIEDVVLTGKERDVLIWCSRGKSNSVIADIVGTSEHTVHFHLKNIFKKLQVNDRTTAVLLAYKKRLISI